MSTIQQDPTIVLDTGRSGTVYAVAFHPDGTHLLGGHEDGIQRWRRADYQEVGNQTGMDLFAISASRDHKWVVCGTSKGASVWDAELREKVLDVEGTTTVYTVDVSPDSTRFATGTNVDASIWSTSSGKRLVGPLEHGMMVTGIRFSPTGEHLATAWSGNSIRVFDSRTGDEVIILNIKTITPSIWPITPLVWSNDGQRILAVSEDNRIRSLQVSTGSQLAVSQILNDVYLNIESIALATNGKFLAAFAGSTITFLDAWTLNWVGPVIEDSATIYSIALSPDCSHLATGRDEGKISVRALGHILPDFYGPFHPSTREERQRAGQPSTSGGHNNGRSDSSVERPGKSESVAHDKDGGGDLLEAEVPSGSAPPEFNYNESLSSACSAHPQEEDAASPGISSIAPQLLDVLPKASPRDAPQEENANANTAKSSQGISPLKRLLPRWIRKSNEAPTLHELDRVPGRSRRAANHRSRTHSPARAGPSRMAATKRVPRMVATSPDDPQRKPPAKAADRKHKHKGTSHGGQDGANSTEADPTHEASNGPHPLAGRMHLRDQQETGDVIFAVRLPAWLCCRGSATEDGTHGSR